MRIRKQFRFESAHVLPHHNGKCGRLHGHSYMLEVVVRGNLQQMGATSGMVMDFAEVSDVVRDCVLKKLDHRSLNEVLENPTCERVAWWIWHELAPGLPRLDEVTLWETATASATLRSDDLTDTHGGLSATQVNQAPAHVGRGHTEA